MYKKEWRRDIVHEMIAEEERVNHRGKNADKFPTLSINSAENQLRYPRVNLAAKLPSWLDEQQAAPLPEPNSQPGRV
ncbi:hypothetical protein QLX08_011462 [Tetragonisca angustula]|uniref:Uncharacterized protein n=1 Tax=Tetragonisca angustula TaxID=166442 RepID=A0AAW0Z8A1_9HYME